MLYADIDEVRGLFPLKLKRVLETDNLQYTVIML